MHIRHTEESCAERLHENARWSESFMFQAFQPISTNLHRRRQQHHSSSGDQLTDRKQQETTQTDRRTQRLHSQSPAVRPLQHRSLFLSLSRACTTCLMNPGLPRLVCVTVSGLTHVTTSQECYSFRWTTFRFFFHCPSTVVHPIFISSPFSRSLPSSSSSQRSLLPQSLARCPFFPLFSPGRMCADAVSSGVTSLQDFLLPFHLESVILNQ